MCGYVAQQPVEPIEQYTYQQFAHEDSNDRNNRKNVL